MKTQTLLAITIGLLGVVAAIFVRVSNQPLFIVLWVFLGAALWFFRGYFTMQAAEEKATLTKRGNEVKIDIIQNGPFETLPSGTAWYTIGARINLRAFPTPRHAFKNWTCDTDLIEILNPMGASTIAIVKGPGVITGNFE
jgi:hypothetical protein